MAISRRNLRKGLVVAGCLFGHIALASSAPGLVLIFVGGVLHWLSKAYLEQNRDLTTAGPYRWTRNPFYLANLLVDAGIVCVIGQVWIPLVYFPFWAFAYAGTIRGEEERLREIFGSRFDAYVAVVPRFFPIRPPLDRSLVRGRFDVRNPSLMQGREYARLLGIALAPAAIGAAEILRTLRLEILAEGNGRALGIVLLVPALWIVKLGLAETFRRPEVSLLPSAESERVLGVWAWIICLPLLYAALFSGPTLHRLGGLLLIAGIVLARRRRVPKGLHKVGRIVGQGLLVIFTLVLGLITNELWLAVAPALWFTLAALDDVGRLRCGASEEASPGRPAWRYFPRIAAGTFAGLLAVGAARVLLV